ncbi:hypothetical protein [Leptothoe sp. PORK10 BA2]|uniref:hypothetical protein n=1 Tax=Leptothoe sp. PORK10 BA2 TaxID=3110254 RepID=UPI002B21B462|nr:hypothetical protein [Leptothoe sp. PORK10 BA2]MEA5466741.1 hypothetical protein [Leptothoe sp. PORK10 BA2]
MMPFLLCQVPDVVQISVAELGDESSREGHLPKLEVVNQQVIVIDRMGKYAVGHSTSGMIYGLIEQGGETVCRLA